MPVVELPPTTPLTLQVTAVFEVAVTVAVNCCDWPAVKEALIGLTLTPDWLVIVTVPLADWLESCWLMAVTVTVFGEGAFAGAV